LPTVPSFEKRTSFLLGLHPFFTNSKYEIINLPKDINISTMCASCKLNNKINLYNIENYLKINDNNVITKKISNNNIETLLPIIKSKRKKKNQKNSNKKNFYNQITIVMRVTNGMYKNLIEEPKINMKLFKNGSIQMSGCKNVYNINIALNKIINIIKKSCTTEHSFIDDIKNDICINNFKIDMINSNYKYYIQIDRIKLHELLIKKKIRSTYEPCIKACVIIKIPNINPNINSNINNKDISVFIFQKGNIIINSAKSCEQIISTYNYINDILYTYKDDIIKKDEQLEINDIFKY
jgi:TATA-box binding protein (TBP) (component of TFIID and TFIIIB)